MKVYAIMMMCEDSCYGFFVSILFLKRLDAEEYQKKYFNEDPDVKIEEWEVVE